MLYLFLKRGHSGFALGVWVDSGVIALPTLGSLVWTALLIWGWFGYFGADLECLYCSFVSYHNTMTLKTAISFQYQMGIMTFVSI